MLLNRLANVDMRVCHVCACTFFTLCASLYIIVYTIMYIISSMIIYYIVYYYIMCYVHNIFQYYIID